jgi:hypothetical protein
MARKIHPLTDTQIKAAKQRDKDYSLFDGGGMYLLVNRIILKSGVLSIRARIPKKAH